MEHGSQVKSCEDTKLYRALMKKRTAPLVAHMKETIPQYTEDMVVVKREIGEGERQLVIEDSIAGIDTLRDNDTKFVTAQTLRNLGSQGTIVTHPSGSVYSLGEVKYVYYPEDVEMMEDENVQLQATTESLELAPGSMYLTEECSGGVASQQHIEPDVSIHPVHGGVVMSQTQIGLQKQEQLPPRLYLDSNSCQFSNDGGLSTGYYQSSSLGDCHVQPDFRDCRVEPDRLFTLGDEVTVIAPATLRRNYEVEEIDSGENSFDDEHPTRNGYTEFSTVDPSTAYLQSVECSSVAYSNDDCDKEVAEYEHPKPPARAPHLRRSLSDQGHYDQRIAVGEGECAPLDLSMRNRSSSVQPFDAAPSSDSDNQIVISRKAPKYNNLMQLANAVSFVIENDPQSSEAFHSSRSSPCSSSESNSSHSTLDEKQQEYRSVDSSQEFLTGSQENSLDGLQEIKYEISDNFEPQGIILNSNVLGDKVYHDDGIFRPIEQINVVQDDDRNRVLKDVANLTVEDVTLEYSFVPSVYHDYLSSSDNSIPNGSIIIDDGHGSGSPSSSSSSGASGNTDGRYRREISSSLPPSESKRRLRLGKAEYESMSEEDRRMRHRVLDNQRSKQYRERRRRMQSTLQASLHELEQKNGALKSTFEDLQMKTSNMQELLSKFSYPKFKLTDFITVKTECML